MTKLDQIITALLDELNAIQTDTGWHNIVVTADVLDADGKTKRVTLNIVKIEDVHPRNKPEAN